MYPGYDASDQERDYYGRVLLNISTLPHKILQNYNSDNLSQMILYELCNDDNGFAIKRAAYLIDNPDFDHIAGSAGFSNKEVQYYNPSLWEDSKGFKESIKKATFHSDVKKFLKNSLKRKDINLNDSDDILELGHLLGIDNTKYFSWGMKHGNHGILIYDPVKEKQFKWKKKMFHNFAALLSMVSII